MYRFLLFCSVVLCCGVFGYHRPPTPCARDNSNCLTNLVREVYLASFQNEHEFQIEPLFHKRIDAVLPTMVFTLTNTTTKGFKSCQIKEASISSDKTSIHVAMYCPRFEIFGHYDVDGKVKLMVIQGNGGFTLDASDYDINLEINLGSTNRNGKRYIKIVDYNAEAQLKGKLKFNLGNLFNGNKDLATLFVKLVEEQPKVITDLLQKPVLDANFKKLVAVFNKAFENVPIDGFIA